jgi:uncharacterized RDD family membrane protein YckC
MVHGHPYAGFWRRVGGYLLDLLVLLVPSVVIYIVAFRAFAGPYADAAGSLLWWPISVAYVVIGNGLGGTFGKRWLGLRVVDATGAVPGMRRAAVRAILPYGVSLVLILISGLLDRWLASESPTPVDAVLVWALVLLLLLPLLLDYLWMIWDPRKQTLHDKLAGTFVVQAR